MKTNTILLSSAAIIALLGAMSVARPAVAQSIMNPPQYSSPAERAETQQLNDQNLNGTTQSPAELNGGTSTSQPGYYGGEQPPYGSAQSGDEDQQDYPAPNDQQTQYQQQMQQYENQQQDYQDQRDQYENEKDRYRHNLSWYDQARWNYDYPHAFVYEFDEPRLVQLHMMSEPSQQLAGAPVEGPNGVWVGRGRNIETAPDGRPSRVEIALNRRVSVWVDPHDLRFDPDEHVVYTDLTRHALWDMPGARVENAS
jgi:hypothetical protein